MATSETRSSPSHALKTPMQTTIDPIRPPVPSPPDSPVVSHETAIPITETFPATGHIRRPEPEPVSSSFESTTTAFEPPTLALVQHPERYELVSELPGSIEAHCLAARRNNVLHVIIGVNTQTFYFETQWVVRLPSDAVTDATAVSTANGVLTINIPRQTVRSPQHGWAS